MTERGGMAGVAGVWPCRRCEGGGGGGSAGETESEQAIAGPGPGNCPGPVAAESHPRLIPGGP